LTSRTVITDASGIAVDPEAPPGRDARIDPERG